MDNLSKRLDEEISAPLAAEFQRDDPEAMLAKIHAGIEDLNRSLANVAEASDAARSVVTLNRPRPQPHDREHPRYQRSASRRRAGSGAASVAPVCPAARRAAADRGVSGGATICRGRGALDDAAARLEAVSAAGGGDRVVIGAAELEEIQAALRLAFSRFQSAETYLWEQMRK